MNRREAFELGSIRFAPHDDPSASCLLQAVPFAPRRTYLSAPCDREAEQIDDRPTETLLANPGYVPPRWSCGGRCLQCCARPSRSDQLCDRRNLWPHDCIG